MPRWSLAATVDVYLPRDRASLDVANSVQWTGFWSGFPPDRTFADDAAWLALHPGALVD